MLAHEISGAGPPLTLLHGFTQNRSAWRELIALLPTGKTFISVDLPGHGESPAGPATMDHAANELLATWDRLGVERTHLAGYSLGGRLALWVAEAHPERLLSLLTIGAHGGLEGSRRESRRLEDERLAGRIEAEGIEWFAAEWASRPIFASLAQRRPDLAEPLRAMRLANDPAGLAAALRGMGAAATEPFWSRLGRIKGVPATFVAGAEDAPYVEAAHRLAEMVPGGRVEIVAEAGHAAHLERPAAVATVLGRHLSSR